VNEVEEMLDKNGEISGGVAEQKRQASGGRPAGWGE